MSTGWPCGPRNGMARKEISPVRSAEIDQTFRGRQRGRSREGRRLRYLVWDANNDKLIGIMALGDPVFNLKVRDELIGWDIKDRGKRLVNVLDAYVLGAVPPYNMLLGGQTGSMPHADQRGAR